MPEIDADNLLSAAVEADRCPPLKGVGIYALLLKQEADLPTVEPGHSGLLYLGMTEDGLDARNHFNHRHSGFSTFRRSLGALLKERLGLTAIPRSSGSSQTNMRNFRFTDEGEKTLTAWMKSNLLIAQMEITGDVRAVECLLISHLQPPLCLLGWKNPQAATVKRLRAVLVREAKQNRSAN